MPHALHLGLVSKDPSDVLTADSFKTVRTKARHLAILCGFQVRMAKGGSNKRRVWVCASSAECPFAIVAQNNKHGIEIRAKLEHNHAFHVMPEQGKRYTTATTEELACYVRQSDVYQHATDINKLTGKQISDIVFTYTGRHVKANRASVIKKLLVHFPERVVPCASLFRGHHSEPPQPLSSTPLVSEPSSSRPPPSSHHPTLAMLPVDASPVKTMAEAVWDCFVCIVNAPWTVERLGVARVRHMVAVFKHDRDTLRATLLMTCPRYHALPCMATNPPDVEQFVEQYLRQTDLGFY
ncbi:hypothetical protein DYB38_006354 [Aphanomyces astaci]|uniref:Uncharacterized protein n=1 Tax=Aphanomyces astaci TaxID=112090 RepID=A0A397CBU7_APHAT|nr:hypothetical protein DYB38_006354 [Aphanomyces astaci]